MLSRQIANLQARVLALQTLAICIGVMSILPGVVDGIIRIPAAEIAWQTTLLAWIGALAYFGTGYWLHLAYLFPFPSRFFSKRRRLSLFFCYAPALILLPDKLLGLGKLDMGWWDTLSGFAVFAMMVQFVAGIVILRRKRKRTTNTLERRQLRAVFLGAMLGPAVFFVPILLLVLYAIVLPGDLNHIPEIIVIGVVMLSLGLAFLPIPLSLLYAFRKYRMMEVELRLRRGTRFAVTTGGLLVVFFGLLYGITTLLLHTFSLHSGTVALATGLVLALSFAPVQRRTQRMVEQKFFPERNRLRAMLAEVLASASSMPDRAALWESLQNGLKNNLGMTAVIPVLYDERTNAFRASDNSVVPLNPDGDLGTAMLHNARPLLVDELLATGRIPLSQAEAGWLKAQRSAVLLPMVIHQRLTGFLVLSFSTEQEDIAAEDLNVLASVVSQVALQSENLRLIEENIEKHRLQEQLAMARKVQERFLPQVLPETPGLQVAARFRSSLEVAGDYYDVVPLEGGRTLLAVGDVAGKGAGAAMIMANVQASLRSMARAGVPLATMVSGVNDLLCANTSPEQFVTFFAAIYSPAEKSFTCINAGHNPPRMVHADGTITLLEAGGLCLGIFSGAPYQEEMAAVNAGDLLMAFTDGVCEAMNSAEEEFGEDRIAEICRDNAAADSASIIETVEKSAIAFHGSDSFDDDFTLLVAKVS